MIAYVTNGVQAARIRARIRTFLINAGFVEGTLGADDALRSAVWRISDVGR